jgi:tRNA1(Val) A37 N6-methylase TrmN6
MQKLTKIHKKLTKKLTNKLNISLASKLFIKKTQKQQQQQHQPHQPHHPDQLKLNLNLTTYQYPLYKNAYKLNIPKIVQIIKNMKSQIFIYSKPPIIYKGYPPNKFKTLNLYSKSDSRSDARSKYYIIKSAWNDNLELNSLTDYFSEPCRIQCTFKHHLSPLDYWNKHWKNILKTLKHKHQAINNYNLREEVYIKNKPCNNFRISVCLEVLKLFKPTKWLDISAGWGDRLLSALLYAQLNKQFTMYCGVDPNPCLHPYYQEMIKTFNPLSKKEYILIKDGFETAKLPNTKFDLVFSSPPFFDLEIYSNANTNSLIKYKGEDGWFNGFLMPSLYKAIEYLEDRGYLVLYMGESHGTIYIPKMIELMNARIKNIGMFYYTDGAKLREFFCWQKINT